MRARVAESEAGGPSRMSIPCRPRLPVALQRSCSGVMAPLLPQMARSPVLRRVVLGTLAVVLCLAVPAPAPAQAPPPTTERAEQVDAALGVRRPARRRARRPVAPEPRRLRHARRVVQHAHEREHHRGPRPRRDRRPRRPRAPRRADRADGRRAHARSGLPGLRQAPRARDGALPRARLDARRRRLPPAARARLARPAGRRGPGARGARTEHRRAARTRSSSACRRPSARPPTASSTRGRDRSSTSSTGPRTWRSPTPACPATRRCCAATSRST